MILKNRKYQLCKGIGKMNQRLIIQYCDNALQLDIFDNVNNMALDWFYFE